MSLRKYGILLILSVFVGFQSDALTGYLTMVIGSLFVAYISFILKIRAARLKRAKEASPDGEPKWSDIRGVFKYFFLIILSTSIGIYNGVGTGFLTFILGLPIFICLGAYLRVHYPHLETPYTEEIHKMFKE